MRSGRCGSLSRWPLVALVVLWLGCDEKDPAAPAIEPPADSWEDVCIDDDGDGYGLQCDKGSDCDDEDPAIHEGCKACAKPNLGCSCADDALPVDCTLSKEVTSDGTLLCKTGTRYCRDGKWSGCEGIRTFAAPPPSTLLTSSLIDPDAGPVICSSCSPDCYQVEDTVGPDASFPDGSTVTVGPNGGITISSRVSTGDGGVLGEGGSGSLGDGGLLDDPDCVPGTAPDFDCDGIPDDFDPLPGSPPFSSDHNTIFMDLSPGDTQEESFEIRFYLNTADIYLYLDMTASMDGEKTNLINSLRTGNYLANGGAGIECADRNFNGSTADEESLKTDGIAGNLACLIRDSRLGAGWHRDLPFSKPDAAGYAYGPQDFEMFGHEQDITNDVDAVLAALNRFETRGGINRPEGGIMGLYALATGAELYAGWDRPGNPARSGCPAGTWGYPCFRDDAVPIVIWMTDAPVTNGPTPTQGNLGPAATVYCNNCLSPVTYFNSTQPVFWDPDSLGIEKGSDGKYNAVPNTNDTLARAFDLGSINDSFKTYTGNTTGMAANITYTDIGYCTPSTTTTPATNAWSSSAEGAPDAFFKFTVTEAEPITISTRGSRFQTTLAIFDPNRINPGNAIVTNVQAPYGGSAQSIGTFASDLSVSGTINTTDAATLTRDSFGSCGSSNGSSDKARAQVMRFNLANDVAQLRVVSNPNFAVTTALFAAPPGAPSADTDMNSVSVPYATTTRTGNSNDYFGGYNAGDMTGAYRRLVNGTTNNSYLSIANFPASYFTTVPACAGVTSTSRDAVVDFSLSARTHLRIEGAGNSATLAAGFDHVIGLVKRTTTVHQSITGNFTDATAYAILPSDMPADATVWSQYSGALGGVTTQYIQSEVGPFQTATATDCTNGSANNNGSQAVFAMDVTSTQSYDFTTAGSGLSQTWISIHEDYADTQSTFAVTTQPNNGDGNFSNIQDMGTIHENSVFATAGSLAVHNTTASTADFVYTGALGCGGTSVAGGRDAVYRFNVTSPQTISVRVGSTSGTALSPGNPGFNSYVAVFQNGLAAGNRIAGDCTDQGGTGTLGSEVTNVSVTPGNTYYVLVKSVSTTALSGSAAAYGVWLRDTTFNTHYQACNTQSDTNAAKITRTLNAGHRYYIVVKGGTAGAGYNLNVRRTPTTDVGMLDCDRNSGGTNHSVIERWLDPGNYSVIIRGYSTAYSTYNLIFRDLEVAPTALGCQYDANTATPSALTLNNVPARDSVTGDLIDYYLVMRASSATSNGAYTVHVDNGSLGATYCAPYNNVTMTDTVTRPAMWYSNAGTTTYTDSQNISNGEWKGTLPVGTYYAVLKGYNTDTSAAGQEDDDWGMYQLTIGDQTNFEQTGTFADERWLGAAGDGTSGVRKALLNREIKVITVDSTSGSGDDATYSDQQLRTIAQSTGAVAQNGTALFFKINSNGTGLGTAIVDAVNQLAGNLAMDVSVRLVESPDSPAPKHFNFKVEAIDTIGDLCQAPVDTDNDPQHTPDTHRKCTPGAVPRFKVTLSNPVAPNSVPTNPRDPQGGYNMRLDLIGDGQYVVDQIPIYIIPEDVVEQAGETRYSDSGVYEQIVDSNGCFGTEAPAWRDLSWNAEIPNGTTVQWNLCTGDTEAELASCTLKTAAVVQTGAQCITDANCPVGYCNATNLCEVVVGPACTSNSACGLNGACVSGQCQWSDNPMDVKPALALGQQGKRYARVQVLMNSNATHTKAPTIYSWGLKYTCSAQE